MQKRIDEATLPDVGPAKHHELLPLLILLYRVQVAHNRVCVANSLNPTLSK